MLNDWHALGSAQYRKWHVYDMAWGKDMALENYIVSGAPFGGPLALFPDIKRYLAQNNGQEPTDLKLSVYTSAGKLLAEINWTDRPIIALGWTSSETLVTVADQGCVRIYTVHCLLALEFQILSISDVGPILECHFWGNGLAAMTSNCVIKVAEGLASSDLQGTMPRIYKLDPKLPKSDSYTAMAIVTPQLSKSGFLEVLLGTAGKSIVTIHESGDGQEVEDQYLAQNLNSPPAKISLSPDGAHIAVYRRDGILTVMTSNFSNKIVDFDTRSASRPLAVEWCGPDAVLIRWLNTGIVMVGPFGDWLNFPYDTIGLVIVPEPDCCRIVSSRSCEILQMVSQATVSALEIGSTEPAALILDAMEAFEEGDAKSDENIRIIAAANQLQEAVQACVQAAGAEFFPPSQQRLLKAASYGKAFAPEINPSDFVETAKRLRVLNAIRQANVGIPVTMQQYLTLSPEVLVGRLTVRNEHYLALKICELLRLKCDQVLIHWASEKIGQMAKQGAGDEEIFHTIMKQLDSYLHRESNSKLSSLLQSKISYLSIAQAACSMGRNKLAIRLLDQETALADQIPLLLRMQEEELALQKAVLCQNSNIVYFTLITLENRLVGEGGAGGYKQNLEKFFKLVSHYPEAISLLKIYYQYKVSSNTTMSVAAPSSVTPLHPLLSLFLFYRQYTEASLYLLSSSLTQLVDENQRLKVYKDCLNILNYSPPSAPATSSLSSLMASSSSKDYQSNLSLHKSLLEEQSELLTIQNNLLLRFNTRRNFVGLSLSSTIELLLTLSLEAPEDRVSAETEIGKLVKKFKLSEKMLYYMKLHLYSSKGEWQLLIKLGTEKKPPIGYKAFAITFINHKRPEAEVERFIEKLSDLEDRYELYMDLKNYGKAADMGAKLKDPDRLAEVARVCRDVILERSIQELLSRM